MTVTSTRTKTRKTRSPLGSSRTIPRALKTHSEMMIDRLYIAALRTRHHKKKIPISCSTGLHATATLRRRASRQKRSTLTATTTDRTDRV